MQGNASGDLKQTVEDLLSFSTKFAPGNPCHEGSEGKKRHKVISLGSFSLNVQ